jgi:hypothetical protein
LGSDKVKGLGAPGKINENNGHPTKNKRERKTEHEKDKKGEEKE